MVSRYRFLRIAAWTIGIVLLAVAVPFIWPFLGIAVVYGTPIVIIVMVVRAAIKEFWGPGPDHRRDPVGSFGLSHIPAKRKRIRHLWTINSEKDRTE